MNKFVRSLGVALLGLWAGVALAGSLAVTWTHPTLNTDSSVIPAPPAAGSLISTRVEFGTCQGTNIFGTKLGEASVNYPATSLTISNVAPGLYCIHAFSKNTYIVESAASLVVNKQIVAPTPQPPVIVTVTAVAYEWHTKHNELRLAKVGTVALGVPCDAQITGNYYELNDISLVKFNRKYRGGDVVVVCG